MRPAWHPSLGDVQPQTFNLAAARRRDYCFKNPRRALIDACPNLELPPATHPIGFGFAVSVEMVRLDNLNQRTERGVRCVESRSAVRVIKIVRQPTRTACARRVAPCTRLPGNSSQSAKAGE